MKGKPLSISQKKEILQRDNYACRHCGATSNLHIHHIKLRSEGGTNDPNNLITLCRKCHAEQHSGKPYALALVNSRGFKQEDLFDTSKGYLLDFHQGGVRMFYDVNYPDEMTFAERGRLATLAKKIWSNTNMLAYRGNGGVKPMTVEQIGEVIQLKPYQTRAFLRKMVRLGVMAKATIEVSGQKETQWYISPLYFFSSKYLPLNLYLLFRKQLDGVLPEWVKQKFSEAERAEQAKMEA
jgi:hypothetical protein